MSLSPAFLSRIHRLYTGVTNFAHSSKPAFIVLACSMGALQGCDGSENAPTARLTAMESSNVPGRMELDGSFSVAGGERKLVAHTYTVKNLDTGETVYGPVTIEGGPNRGPLKVHPYADTASTNGVKDVSGNYQATLTVMDDVGQMHTAVTNFELGGAVSYAIEDCDATCSLAPGNSNQVVCSLNTSCNQAVFWTNIATQASLLNSAIDENTTLWIQAIGAGGGNGTNNSVGGGSGEGGKGGFAQMVTTGTEYGNIFGNAIFYYYLGQAGSHDSSGGAGGAATIVTSFEPDGSLPHNEIVLIAGGGGGGGEGSAFYSGSMQGGGGGNGGFAYSSQVGKSATGVGANAFYDGLPSLDGSWFTNTNGMGGGGTDCTEGVACGGDGHNGGYQGFGGASGGSGSEGSKGWINGGPNLAVNAGKGGEGGNPATCGGGGGGGYGGGGSGTVYGTDASGGDDYRCYGGGGGGSYAMPSTRTDSKAPTSYAGNSGNGEVLFIFNTDPS
ncbi:hypothetical protein SHLO109777_02695 [Shewanella loihica]|uniref:Uncharacterized protein n=1 Tax=Shewanella loihica (strain ATCC BAA-1088 / PV-4) TaxID=323850 RepID=A3QDR8_SHELP|nr:hypothetical protein [Shewanella loihica]ABO23616.1 hypothetical protein Shew_1749 [Shewanella loihica PV-4]